MPLTKRVEVLFDPKQYKMIEQLAHSEGKTVGALVRKAVEQVYLKPTLEKRKEAVEGILSEQSDLTWEEAKIILETDVGRRFESFLTPMYSFMLEEGPICTLKHAVPWLPEWSRTPSNIP